MGTLVPRQLRRVSLRTLRQRRMSGVHPHPVPGPGVERIERSSPPRVKTSMGILALRVRVETPHETEFVGKELSKDLSDLRGEPARGGGVWQRPLSVFPVDPLEAARPERTAARARGIWKGEAVEGRVRGRRALQHHHVPRRIPKFGFLPVPQVRVRRYESLSRMENRDVHGSLDPVPERGRTLRYDEAMETAESALALIADERRGTLFAQAVPDGSYSP